MKLTTDELQWVNQRMDTYHITYQEIYDELSDHMISAVETARINGDHRAVETIFDEIISIQFPGHNGIQEIALKYIYVYNRKIRKTMRGNFEHYLTWQMMLAVAALIITSFYLPTGWLTTLILVLALLVIALITPLYVIRKFPKVKAIKSRQSMVKSFVLSRSRNLMLISNFFLCVIGFWARRWHIGFLNPFNYHPAVYMVLLTLFIIYGLSCVRLCRQELKIEL